MPFSPVRGAGFRRGLGYSRRGSAVHSRALSVVAGNPLAPRLVGDVFHCVPWLSAAPERELLSGRAKEQSIELDGPGGLLGQLTSRFRPQ